MICRYMNCINYLRDLRELNLRVVLVLVLVNDEALLQQHSFVHQATMELQRVALSALARESVFIT